MNLKSLRDRFFEAMKRDNMAIQLDHLQNRRLFDGEDIDEKFADLMSQGRQAEAVEFMKRAMEHPAYSLAAAGRNITSGNAQAAIPTTQAGVGYSAIEMLAMRMHWPIPRHMSNPAGWRSPKFAGITIHRGATKALVFIVMDGDKHVVLEDDINMFPSDQLVNSIRVLEG